MVSEDVTMCVRNERSKRTEPGTVIAVNESDEAKATRGTLDSSEVIHSNWKQMNLSSGFIRP